MYPQKIKEQEKIIVPSSRFQIIDSVTGEIVENRVLLIGKNPHMSDKNFVKFFVGFLQDLLEDKEIYKGSLRLLLYAISKIDYNTLELTLDAHDAAKELNVSVQAIWLWKSILIRKGYLERVIDNQTGRKKYLRYRIKQYTAVRGQMSKVKITAKKTQTVTEIMQLEVEQ